MPLLASQTCICWHSTAWRIAQLNIDRAACSAECHASDRHVPPVDYSVLSTLQRLEQLCLHHWPPSSTDNGVQRHLSIIEGGLCPMLTQLQIWGDDSMFLAPFDWEGAR